MIKKTFTFEKVGPNAAENFKEKAQFTMSDLRRATKDYFDSLVSMEMIVSLFEYHKILGALPITGDAREPTLGPLLSFDSPPICAAVSVGTLLSIDPTFSGPPYFMPIILKNATKSELENTRGSPCVAPLMCQYTCGFMPFGVFSALIIALVSEEQNNWTLKRDSPCRNKIEFLVGDDCDTVTLISHPTFVKIVLYRELHPNIPTSTLCADIRCTLTTTLRDVNKTLRYLNAKFEYGFECQCCQSYWLTWYSLVFSTTPHLCVLKDETSTKMFCLKDRTTTNIVPLIDAGHKIWFEKICLNNENLLC